MTLDPQDQLILIERQAMFTARTEPKQGDFIRFADGSIKRIARVWHDENGNAEHIQPTTGNGNGISFYIGEGYMSFSGGLDSGIDAAKFTRTNETMEGRAWFFHHDWAKAHNGIEVVITCPVWECAK